MQWLTLIAACREFGGRTARIPLACPWKLNSASKQLASRPWAYHHTSCSSPYTEGAAFKHNLPNVPRQNVFLAGQKSRQYSTGSDKGPTSGSNLGISVVGIPDPILWIRNKIILFLIQLYFDLSSVEFEKGAKQALVYVSNLLSHGKFEELRDVVSNEVFEHAWRTYKTLTEAQRRNLAVAPDDIIFLIPEDVSLFFDSRGRKFCYIVMRFWHLSSADVPEDPESTRIFKVAEAEGEAPPRRIVTAVYEFHRELTNGAPLDWTITSIWHWKQLE
ncbi:m-AAA protease-interacting protein 1, mitochondrial [Anguilla rostrata]|uniref:m-AAA protease-interacting protein 1, mitochondrial n=1 Tax=Anguilla rostrata TaxID=7938 RepID=UPI0030D16BEE